MSNNKTHEEELTDMLENAIRHIPLTILDEETIQKKEISQKTKQWQPNFGERIDD